MSKLPKEFYLQQDVINVARELLGKKLCTRINNQLTTAIIAETEAYKGKKDRACHAFGGRRTKRTEVMYAEGSTAYVYLCYGIHHLFNVVTNKAGVPEAVLVRAVIPKEGITTMTQRRNKPNLGKSFTGGPGTVSQALGIQTKLSGISLLENTIWIEETGITVADKNLEITPRIGVDYAGKDALLPYRFIANL